MAINDGPLSRKVYILEVVMNSGSKGIHLSLETIGVYSTKNEALKAIQKLPPETDRMVYNIQSFILNAPAVDIVEDTSKNVKELMDLGVIDQLVGEDGQFYYVLTEFGKEVTKQAGQDDPRERDPDKDKES